MTATITSGNAASQTRWADKVYTQHFNDNWLNALMTPGNGGLLKGALVFEDFPQMAGETVNYHFKNELPISAVKTGDTRIQGTGVDIGRGTDSFTLDEHRAATPVRQVGRSQQRTKHDLVKEAQDSLANLAGRYVASKTLEALTATTSGRTSNVYTYGASLSNYNATHATAMGNVDSTDDKLTLQLLQGVATRIKTTKAGRGFMAPAEIATKSGAPAKGYVGLFHPRAIRDLKRDSDFKNYVQQKENPEFDVIEGADFVGKFEGIYIYSLPPIDTDTDNLLVSGAGASSIDVAHNLILGAGACVLGYGNVAKPVGNTKYSMQSKNRMMVTMVDDDHARDTELAFTMSMAFRKLVDNSSGTAEDMAVHHLFTSAAAGL